MPEVLIKSNVLNYLVLVLFTLQLSACSSLNNYLAEKNIDTNERAIAAVQVPSRIENVKEKQEKIITFLDQANEAWAIEDLDRLEQIYKELDTYDKGNIRAKQGLENVAMARRHQAKLEEIKELIGKSDDDDVIAKEKLHRILLERPDHQEAKALYESLIQKEAHMLEEKSKVKLGYNKPLTLQFRDIKLGMLFEALSKITDISFIYAAIECM